MLITTIYHPHRGNIVWFDNIGEGSPHWRGKLKYHIAWQIGWLGFNPSSRDSSRPPPRPTGAAIGKWVITLTQHYSLLYGLCNVPRDVRRQREWRPITHFPHDMLYRASTTAVRSLKRVHLQRAWIQIDTPTVSGPPINTVARLAPGWDSLCCAAAVMVSAETTSTNIGFKSGIESFPR